jgi:hypothetical protein
MSDGTIFLVVALVTLIAYGRDLFSAARTRGKRLDKDAERAHREPFEMSNIILDSTKEAVDVQTAVLLDLRMSLEDEMRKRKIAEQERDTAKRELYAYIVEQHLKGKEEI